MIKGKGKRFSVAATVCGIGVLLLWAFFVIRDRTALRDALRDPSPEIRFPAATVLLDLDSKAPDAIRVLEQGLNDRRRRIRSAARYHLLMGGRCFVR